MKKNIWKRLLSLALALVLVAGWLPELVLKAEAANPAATFTVDGVTYTFTVTKWSNKYRDYIQDNLITEIEFTSASRQGNTISVSFHLWVSNMPETPFVRSLQFTDTDCGNELDKTVVISKDNATNLHEVVRITRAAAEHTGGTSCSSPNCTRCGTSYFDHDYSWTTDGTYHWQVCANNSAHTTDKELHTGGSPTCQTSAVCSVCGNSYYADHDYDTSVWEWDNGKHYHPCKTSGCTSRSDEAPCIYSNATCQADSSCSACGHVHAARLNHDYTYIANGNILTETCPNGCGHSATATLSAEDKTYTGSAIAAAITYSDNWVGSKPTEISYTDNVNVGTATATITVEGQTMSTTFQIAKADITDATVTLNPESGTYTGIAYAPAISVVYNNITLAEGTDYTVSWNDTGMTDAGIYTATVTGIGNFEGVTSKSFTVNAASLSDITVAQVGTLTYTGEAQTPTVSTSATAVNGQTVTFTYFDETDSDGREGTYGALPKFTEAGTYTVKYRASAPNHKVSYGEFTVTVDKAVVTEPTIESKTYTGETQVADIADADLYTVEQNNGGTASGSYDVVLKLKDADNYKWATTDAESVTLQFEITKAENIWITEPAIEGWTYGETANAPTYEAKFGEVKTVYTGVTEDGAEYSSETAPVKVGSYTATFTVEDVPNYSGLSAAADFTITPIDASIDGITVDNVTSADQAAIEEVLAAIEAALENETLPEEELSVLEEKKLDVQELLDTIDAVAETIDSALETVSDHNAKTVTSADKKELKEAVGDIDALLEGDNLTEQERAELEEAKADAKELIKKIDAVAEQITDLTDAADAYGQTGVTGADKEALQQTVEEIDELLEGDNLTKQERTELEETKTALEELLADLEEAQQAANTEAVEQVKDVTADNVTTEDQEALENAKADLEAALENYGDRYTEEEKANLEEALQRIDEALAALAEAEVTEDLILIAPAPDAPADGNAAEDGADLSLQYADGNGRDLRWILLLLILLACVIAVIFVIRKKKKQ